MAVYIASAKRTAFGAFGGSLKSLTASQVRAHAPSTLPDWTGLTDPHSATRPIRLGQLGGHAAKAALAELPEGVKVDSVIFGCACCPVFATRRNGR